MIHALFTTLLLAQATPVQPTDARNDAARITEPAEVSSEDSPRTRVEAMLSTKDVRPEVLYNAGVEMYRAGELELARELFATAASRAKAAIAARSMYNRGTTSYAEAVQAMKGASESGQSPADAQKAVIETLERSLRELKDAARADPSNADARANAELAYRVLKELKKQQDQQQQQKQDQQQQDQQQEQKQDDQQQQQNDDSQNQDGKQEPQQEPKNDEQQNDQQQPQKGEQKDGEQKQDEQQQQQEQQSSEADKKPMTKQEVERLLQRIRDKERARILEKLSKERARTKPAPKDW